MRTPSKNQETFTENQFVHCDFWLLLKLSREAWLLHRQVAWTLDQVSTLAKSPQVCSSTNISIQALLQNTSGDSFWIESNLNGEKKNNRV